MKDLKSQFKAWALDNGYPHLEETAPTEGGFIHPSVNAAWKVWQHAHSEMPDPVTIAYIATGVAEAWNENDYLRHRFSEGQSELMGSVIEHARTLDRLCPEEGIAGNFYYEVAEPFGYRMAVAQMQGETLDPTALGQELIDTVNKRSGASA